MGSGLMDLDLELQGIGQQEDLFVQDDVLYINNDKIKREFLKELEKLKTHCSKKASILEKLLQNRVKININLSLVSSQQEGEINGNVQ